MRAWLSAIVIGLALAPLGAKAWTQHALGTWQALQVLPDARQEPPVRVESLEQFLRTQGTALELILREEEQWARANVRNYAPRPEVLAYRFDPKAEAPEWRRRFMAAVRINPSLPLTPFLQLQPLPSVLSANARMEIPVRESQTSTSPTSPRIATATWCSWRARPGTSAISRNATPT